MYQETELCNEYWFKVCTNTEGQCTIFAGYHSQADTQMYFKKVFQYYKANGRVVCVRTHEYHNYLPMITSLALEWIPWPKVMLCGIPHWWCACSMNSWIVVLAEALLIRKGSLQPEYIPYRVTLPFSERKRFNVTSLPARGLLISSWNGMAWKVQSLLFLFLPLPTW